MDRAEQYRALAPQIASVVAGETNDVAKMASIACLLAQEFDHYFWTGFYCVDPLKSEELVVGPYQGTLGCLRIPFGRGVCGKAAATQQTQIVDDVHAFADHIACDARSQSEIVVPVFNKAGDLIAVFDVDSDTPAAFTQADADGLEQILKNAFQGES